MADSRLIFGGRWSPWTPSQVLDPGWVVVSDGVITQLGEGEPPADVVSWSIANFGSWLCRNARMTNAHTHLFQSFFRGLAGDRPLLDWLVNAFGLLTEHITPEIAYHAARIGRESLVWCTTVIDHQYVHPGADGDLIDGAVCRLPTNLVRFSCTRLGGPQYHEPLAEDAATAIQRATVFDQWDGHDGRVYRARASDSLGML